MALKSIFIVDDHPLIHRALSSGIEANAGLTLCGAAIGYRNACRQLKSRCPDAMILEAHPFGNSATAKCRSSVSRFSIRCIGRL